MHFVCLELSVMVSLFSSARINASNYTKMFTNVKFLYYVSPIVAINIKLEQLTGISWDGEHMTVHATRVAAVSRSEALSKLYYIFFFLYIGSVIILIAHNFLFSDIILCNL